MWCCVFLVPAYSTWILSNNRCDVINVSDGEAVQTSLWRIRLILKLTPAQSRYTNKSESEFIPEVMFSVCCLRRSLCSHSPLIQSQSEIRRILWRLNLLIKFSKSLILAFQFADHPLTQSLSRLAGWLHLNLCVSVKWFFFKVSYES